jgi:hypothetical protein
MTDCGVCVQTVDCATCLREPIGCKPIDGVCFLKTIHATTKALPPQGAMFVPYRTLLALSRMATDMANQLEHGVTEFSGDVYQELMDRMAMAREAVGEISTTL